MAEATIVEAVTKTVVQEVEPEKVILTLTAKEAGVLASIFAKIGGDPDKSYRGVMDDIQHALRRVGYSWDSGDGRKAYTTISGNTNLYFNGFDHDNGYFQRVYN